MTTDINVNKVSKGDKVLLIFNRKDICEAWSLAAHDWGDYEVITRLDRIGYDTTKTPNYEHLTENGQAIYKLYEARNQAIYYG